MFFYFKYDKIYNDILCAEGGVILKKGKKKSAVSKAAAEIKDAATLLEENNADDPVIAAEELAVIPDGDKHRDDPNEEVIEADSNSDEAEDDLSITNTADAASEGASEFADEAATALVDDIAHDNLRSDDNETAPAVDDTVSETSQEADMQYSLFADGDISTDSASTETAEKQANDDEAAFDSVTDDSSGTASNDEKATGERSDELNNEDIKILEYAKSKNEKKTKKAEGKERKVDFIFDFVELFVFTLAAVFIITSFFLRYSIVDGGSMRETLHDKDKLILWSFMYEPEHGDVVVLQDTSIEHKDPLVKRVIATEGQEVRVEINAVYVDGKLCEHGSYNVDPSNTPIQVVPPNDTELVEVGTNYYVLIVPDGQIFVMGDNRNISDDSRKFGCVHEDSIIGKVILRFFPFDQIGFIK